MIQQSNKQCKCGSWYHENGVCKCGLKVVAPESFYDGNVKGRIKNEQHTNNKSVKR